MSAVLKPVAETFSFDGEAVGVAGAAALKKVKFLADSAPQGRLFSAIATLSDNAGLAAAEYEAASLAHLRDEAEAAKKHLARGRRATARLKKNADAEAVVPLPTLIRYR